MKKLIPSGCIIALAIGAFAQNGTIFIGNTATTPFRTNTVAFGEAFGNAIAASGGGNFYYEVLTAPSSVTSIGSIQDLVSSTWSDTGVSGTNSLLAGRESGPNPSTANNWPSATEQSYIVVGWSANVGSSWQQIAPKLSYLTKTAQNGSYYWLDTSGSPYFVPEFFGVTSVGQAISGPATFGPAAALFGASSAQTPNPISTPTDLYLIVTPEPGTIAFAGLGLALAAAVNHRRR